MIQLASVKDLISVADFIKLDLRVGEVKDVAPLENSQKLIKLSVDLGDSPQGGERRTILAGLAQYFPPEYFIGRKFIFVANLEPKKMAGLESQGMILAVGCADTPKPIEAPEGAKVGDNVK